MIGKLEKNCYKVGVVCENVTADDVFNALSSQITGRFTVSEYDAEKEYEEIKNIRGKFNQKTQQPTVPIQFVCCDGLIYSVDDVNTNGLRFRCSDFEQIGAVLYVRGGMSDG